MNKIEQNALNNLIKGIEVYVDSKVDKTTDKTKTGIIKGYNDLGYIVEIDGVTYDKVRTIGGTCNTNETVRVMIPNGQWNNMFILKGGSNGGGGGSIDVVEGNGLHFSNNTLSMSTVTTSQNGAMLSSDKTKLDNVESGAQVNDIETIKVNGTTQTITNKSVNITTPTKTSDLTNDEGFITLEDIPPFDTSFSSSSTNAVQNKTINAILPDNVGSDNKLVDFETVADMVQTQSAHFRGSWTTWANVPTDPTLYPEDAEGTTTPTENDYMVVENASDYPSQSLTGTWRFTYTSVWSTSGKNGWKPAYMVNEEPFTTAQMNAINSTATKAKIDSIANKMNMINPSGNGRMVIERTSSSSNDASLSVVSQSGGGVATGNCSSMFGSPNSNSGDYSNVYGNYNSNAYDHTLIHGTYLTATSDYQYLYGQHNDTTNSSNYLEIFGWGDISQKKNIRTFDKEGNFWIAGDYENGDGKKLSDCYSVNDGIGTNLANADYVPILKSSNSKAKTTFTTIKSFLKTYFDTLYSKVVANPSGTATETLSKITIDGTNYNIPSGGGGGSGVELLWTNPSATSAFPSQTVSISNFSDYKIIFIFFESSTSQDNFYTFTYEKNLTLSQNNTFCASSYRYRRSVSFSSNGVLFGNGERASWTSTSFSNGASYQVPVKIYGIK